MLSALTSAKLRTHWTARTRWMWQYVTCELTARAVFTIVSASLPGPWTIKMAPRRIGIMSPPTHRGEEQGDVSRSFVETSEASHPVSFQIETLGILPVSLVKIVLQLLLSHHPFEISRWNCYFLQFHFVWDVPSVGTPARWARWWIAVRETDRWPGKHHHGGLGLKWSTKSIKSYNSHINKCFVGQCCNDPATMPGLDNSGVSVVGLHSSTNWIHWSNYASYDPGGGLLFVL